MKKTLFVLACFAMLSNVSYGSSSKESDKMSIQFSPISFKVWGSTPATITLQFQYKWFMLGYYHIRRQYLDELQSPTQSHTFGAFYKPDIAIGKRLNFSPIVGIFNHRFPTENSAWWAFGLNINCNITDNFGFYIQHLSNAKTAKINPGLDVVGVKYSF